MKPPTILVAVDVPPTSTTPTRVQLTRKITLRGIP
jgi:hypothetical protein